MSDPTIKQILHTADGITDSPMVSNDEKISGLESQNASLHRQLQEAQAKCAEMHKDCIALGRQAVAHHSSGCDCLGCKLFGKYEGNPSPGAPFLDRLEKLERVREEAEFICKNSTVWYPQLWDALAACPAKDKS